MKKSEIQDKPSGQTEKQKAYPGELAEPEDICRLAEEFRNAAHLLRKNGRRGAPLSWAPYRLSAIHAIELYLNAVVLHLGHKPTRVRGMQHDLSARAELVADNLQLKKRTAAHLRAIAGNREYLVTRYETAAMAVSPITRLTATLDEVAHKVTERMSLHHWRHVS